MSEKRIIPFNDAVITKCPLCQREFEKGLGWTLNLPDGSVSHECCSLICLNRGYGKDANK